jgi:hypothetical protein
MADDVDREALHDWLDERDALRADDRPSLAEYWDEDDICRCGRRLLSNESMCPDCTEREL